MRSVFGDRCHLALTLRLRPGDHVRLRLLFDAAQAARVPDGGHGRRALPRPAAPHPPGRGDLHPGGAAPSTMLAIAWSGSPGATSSRRRKRPGCSGTIRRRWHARWRSPPVAPSALPNCATSIPTNSKRAEETPQQGLERLVAESLPLRYPDGVPPDVSKQLRHELALIAGLEYAPYFLTVNSIVRVCQVQGHPMPGPRFPPPTAPSAMCWGRHSHRPGALRPAIRAVHLRRTPRAARHRRPTSSPSAGKKSSSGSTSATAATAPRCAPP